MDDRPIPLLDKWREILDSSILLQSLTQSLLNCLVKNAYRKGFAQLFNGNTKIVNTLASFKLILVVSKPNAAVREKKMMGAQQKKSVNTSKAILLATTVSLLFQEWEARIDRNIPA